MDARRSNEDVMASWSEEHNTARKSASSVRRELLRRSSITRVAIGEFKEQLEVGEGA